MHVDSERNWAIAKAAYPGSIVFVEVDGLYFVRGADVETVRSATGIQTGSACLGFEIHEAHAYMRQLVSRGYSVVKASDGRVVRVQPTSNRRADIDRQRRMGRFVAVDPTLLFDRTELEHAVPTLANREATLFEALKAAFRADDAQGIHDYGAVYVIDAGDGYDIDNGLTDMPYSRVLLIAAAANATGRKLPCQLVPPRFRRMLRGRVHATAIAAESRPVPVGQMGFGILADEWRAD